MRLIVTFLILILTASCAQHDYEKVYKEDLFTIGLGKLEDQIDLFRVKGNSSSEKNDFCMKDGMFYISNNNSLKIMQFSSYGDLLFILYNPDPLINPPPILLQSEEIEGKVTNKYAASYGLQNIGVIAIDSVNNVYVEDSLPPDQTIEDTENKVILNSRILRFDKTGKLIDFFGQDGIGGTAFPYINSIQITKNDELVVTSLLPSAWLVYWFGKDGKLLYSRKFELDKLPKEKKYLTSLSAIYPSYHEQKLYVYISYYSEETDQSTKIKTTIRNRNSRLYTFDMAQKKYTGFFQVAEEGKRKYQGSIGEVEISLPSYEFLGVSENGHFYFLRPDLEYNYELLVMDRSGRTLAIRYLIIDESSEKELYMEKLKLSSNGIIIGLICYKDQAKMVWWRSDKLSLHQGDGK